jgi:hypothetical protein
MHLGPELPSRPSNLRVIATARSGRNLCVFHRQRTVIMLNFMQNQVAGGIVLPGFIRRD